MSLHKLPRTRRNETLPESLELDAVPKDGRQVGGSVDVTDSEASQVKQLIAGHVDSHSKTVDQVGAFTYTLDEYSQSYSYSEILFTVLAIGSYVFDVGSDIYLAFVYHSEGEWWWFGLTVSFIVIPSFIISCFSLAWYIQDHNLGNKVHPIRWIPRILLLFLQLGPLIRLDTDGFNVIMRPF
jgi:hypothetical protein